MGNSESSVKSHLPINYITENVHKLNNILEYKTAIETYTAEKLKEALEIYEERLKTKTRSSPEVKQVNQAIEKIQFKLINLPQILTHHSTSLFRDNTLKDILASSKQLLQEIYDKVKAQTATSTDQLKTYLTTLRQLSVLLDEKSDAKHAKEIERIKNGISLATTDLYIKCSLQENQLQGLQVNDIQASVDQIHLQTLQDFHSAIHIQRNKLQSVKGDSQKVQMLSDQLLKLELEVKLMKAEDHFKNFQQQVEMFCQLDETDFLINLENNLQDLQVATVDIPVEEEHLVARKRQILMDIDMLKFALDEKSKNKQMRYENNLANLRKYCEDVYNQNANALELEEMLAVANDLTTIIREKLGVNKSDRRISRDQLDFGRKMTQVIEDINNRRGRPSMTVAIADRNV